MAQLGIILAAVVIAGLMLLLFLGALSAPPESEPIAKAVVHHSDT
ncbi:MAG TPA: hypothetical protein VGC39_09555 [Candidatus Methylacidiphilales bacterium]